MRTLTLLLAFWGRVDEFGLCCLDFLCRLFLARWCGRSCMLELFRGQLGLLL